mgnify:CR=1 FL=1
MRVDCPTLSPDDDREDVEQVVRPGRLSVIVVAHALGEPSGFGVMVLSCAGAER